MTQDLDEKIGILLREDGIPERDPLFRIRVMERGERLRYRHRSQAVVAGTVLFVAVPAIAFMLQDNALVAGLAALLCIATIAAGVVALRSMLRVTRWLRAS